MSLIDPKEGYLCEKHSGVKCMGVTVIYNLARNRNEGVGPRT